MVMALLWSETLTCEPYARIDYNYGQQTNAAVRAQIHWFTIINSCVTVLLLTGFLATILMRVLKNDFVRFATTRRLVHTLRPVRRWPCFTLLLYKCLHQLIHTIAL